MLKGVGPQTLRQIASLPGFEDRLSEESARKIPTLARSLREDGAWEKALLAASDQIEQASQNDARILSPLDSEYPALLARTNDDPYLLWVRGKLPAMPQKSVAIIGTRKPTPHGIIISQRITQFFVKEGWSIISGLALGCDATAHETALDVGGHTVAVLAHGLHMIAPDRHHALANRILENDGALVSEYPLGRNPSKQAFVKRDKTQAGMSQGVAMI